MNFFGQVNKQIGVVRDGVIRTPFGQLDARNFSEGSTLKVLIRPEAVKVTPLTDKVRNAHSSHILMSRLLGASSLLHICAHDMGGQETHLHARVPGVFLPEEGQPVSLSLDTSQVFLFEQCDRL